LNKAQVSLPGKWLHVGAFSRAGTFAGAALKLNHFAELGITPIEIMPAQRFQRPPEQ
jgi:1,4-alpha-glucan branching enzyme